MANSEPFRSAWGPKQYILAAIAGTLAASAVVVIVSIILRPAHIVFSVTGASYTRTVDGMGVSLNFTLVADNPSRRAGVRYSDAIVRLRLYSTDNRTETLPAVVRESTPFRRPPASSKSLRVSAFVLNDFWDQNLANHGRGGAPPVSVQVQVAVRFKVGRVSSRPYVVAVTCSPVHFSGGKDASSKKRISCSD